MPEGLRRSPGDTSDGEGFGLGGDGDTSAPGWLTRAVLLERLREPFWILPDGAGESVGAAPVSLRAGVKRLRPRVSREGLQPAGKERHGVRSPGKRKPLRDERR